MVIVEYGTCIASSSLESDRNVNYRKAFENLTLIAKNKMRDLYQHHKL